MRGIYFAFHYTRDIWRVNQVRNSGVIEGAKSVGFADRSLWEDAKTKGQRALENLITDGMKGTSVTVVLIGQETASRPWVKFEIEESIRRKNALLGVRIHHLPSECGLTCGWWCSWRDSPPRPRANATFAGPGQYLSAKVGGCSIAGRCP